MTYEKNDYPFYEYESELNKENSAVMCVSNFENVMSGAITPVTPFIVIINDPQNNQRAD
jgi:hypothetical protein